MRGRGRNEGGGDKVMGDGDIEMEGHAVGAPHKVQVAVESLSYCCLPQFYHSP